MTAHYSDDRTSGQWDNELRGMRRVTFVARAEDDSGFEWLLDLKKQLLPLAGEVKSSAVLPVFDNDAKVRETLTREMEPYSIVIVDLHECRRQALDPFISKLKPLIPPGEDPYRFVLQLMDPRSDARAFLRQIIVQESVLGQLEPLLERAADPFGLRSPLKDSPFSGSVRVDLTSKASLHEIDESHLALLLARLGSAVGDMLSPEKQADAVIGLIKGQNPFGAPFLALHQLTWGVQHDRIFDEGPRTVWTEVEDANARIVEYLQQNIHHSIWLATRPGTLMEIPSHLALGIQAADIAVSLAAREYERMSGDEPLARALAVKHLFSRVSLNGRWL